jgi:RNA polymerase sigma-70 factor (ECF subfamily)
MSGTGQDLLRRAFLIGYEELKRRLTSRFGSADLASEALHETWLRIDQAGAAGAVQSPIPYLLRMAFNVALKRLGADRRTVTLDDAQAVLAIVDDAPDPERVTAVRLEAEALARALADLTPRRREILLASRIDGLMLREIAGRLGISQRLVEIELKHALAHCALRLHREVVQRFGPRPRGES